MAQRRRAKEIDDAEAGPGPLRLCALSRAALPKEELIRFVADPEGTIVPDPGARLPGRGVWVRADETAVIEAARAKVFQRSLKRDVRTPPDLADRVAALLERRALDALSIANKAGAVTTGFAQVDALIEKGGVAVLLHASDSAAGGAEKLDKKHRAVARSVGREARIETLFTVDQMSLAMGRSNVVHAALIQGGATEKFLSEAGRMLRYRPVLVAKNGVLDAPET